MDGIIAYILSKKYTNDTVIGMGAIKGAACQVQSINKVGKTTTITLEWEDNVGGVHTQAFDVEDGVDGVSVVGATIDTNGHLILTLSDTNTIDCGKVLPQYDTMPSPSASNEGQVLQYIGTTNVNYTKGYYYECVEYPTSSGTYIWKNIKVQDSEDIFRYNVIPSPSSSIEGAIIQYIGATNATYTNGYYYQCVESPVGSGTYVWVQKNVQPNNGGGGGDGVVDGYYKPADQLFYEDSAFLNPITGEDNTIYVDLNTNGLYRYNGAIFIKVSSSAESIQVDTMPTADSTQLNKIYQYIGTTDTNYTNGYFYKCKFDGTNYYWDGIPTQDAYTKAEIGALSDLPDPSKTVIENISDLQGSLANIDKDKLDNLAPIYLIGSGLTLDTTVGSPTYGKLQATGMSIPVDDHLDASSLNPVQNKVIALTIDQMQGSILEKIQKKLAATADDFVIFTNDGDIADSGISKDIVPSTVSVSNKLLVASDLSTKADKVSGATDNDIALLDNTGNLKDSNKKLSDYQEKLTDGNGVAIDASNNIGLDISYLTASRVGYIPATEKGAHSGVAELDATGKVPSSQLPSYIDDVIDGYYYDATHFYAQKVVDAYYNTGDNQFYEDSAFTTLITPVTGYIYKDVPTGDTYEWDGTAYVTKTPDRIEGQSGVIYISIDSDIQYRWTGTAFAALGGALQLGETSTTAYRGDRGKTAYDHSQITDGSNPHNTTADNVNLKVPISALSGSKLDVESTLYGLYNKSYLTDDTTETTIDDADYVPFYDTSASAKKKISWSNIKSVLKTYFDSIYATITNLNKKADLTDLAPAFDDTATYAIGDYVTYTDGDVYRFTSAHTGAWASGDVTKVDIGAELKNKISKSSTAGLVKNDGTIDTNTYVSASALDGKADLTDLAPTFDATVAYAQNDYVNYNGDIYRFTSAHSAGAWIGSDATQIVITTEFKNPVQWTNL